MHSYDVPLRQAYQPVPPMYPLRPAAELPPARSVHEFTGGSSATPIFDALYAEYVKSFRTLPGDRSGEENLGFTAFGNIPHSSDGYPEHRPGSFSSSYSAYSAGAYSARQQSQWQRVGHIGPQGTGTHHVPAALPPGRGI
ncbi:hypothetical protein ACIQOU_24455 [Streptomyces sp. NPDC091279]|uniref:hypothetical protein n=1 Tax=unclassified Streptomyces TaxID=2593676 RepID=UPI00380FB93F